ncbi:MAG: nanoRNase/pAp phosphatase (c-di-AMP/oligoRNAs hydrolase) [Candidatus Omnitrophota bacterium]|jgi:nanoRNase/pAp phosphatase (c-di-AMP/oligoRNAs hydrolase)
MNQFEETQKKLGEMREALKGVKRLVILTHDNPDPDGISCMLALQKIVKDIFKIPAVIFYQGMVARAENCEMIRLLKLKNKIKQLGKHDIKATDGIALIDCQPNTGNTTLPPRDELTIVIDHHPLRKTTKSKFLDIRVDYGATATILSEYLLASGVEIKTQIATALCYGISSETQHLGRGATHKDTSIYSTLFPIANKKILSQIENPKLPKTYFKTLNRALHHSSVYKNAIFSTLGEINAPDFVPIVADLLLKCERISWSLCIGRFDNKIYLSLRTSVKNVNAGSILRRLVGKKGTAGGHDMLAGGQIICDSMSDSDCDQTEKDVKLRFLKRFGYKEGGEIAPLLLETT